MVHDTVHNIAHFAEDIEKALALAGGGYTLRDVAMEIVQGGAQLWVRDHGLIITQVCEEPAGRYLLFWIAAGDMSDVLGLLDDIYAWARSEGMTRAIFRGRRGWQRVLEDDGWRANRNLVTYERDL